MMNIGVIGAGGIGAIHLKQLGKHPDVKVAAICDTNRKTSETQSAAYGAMSYTDAHEMLDKEQLDAIYVCIPPFCHGDLEETAAARGIHLMVEKPLGLDMETVRRKAESIAKSGIIAASGYCLRYMDTVAIAKQYLSDKKIAMIRAHYLTVPVNTPWWRKKELSGGQLVEQSTHTLDLVRYLGGEIVRLYANMGLLVMDDIPDLDIPDVGVIQFTLDNGAFGHMQTGFIQFDHRTGIELMGRDFRVTLDDTTLRIAEPDKETIYRSKTNFYQRETDAFVRAIQQNDRSLILASYEDGMKTLETTLAANASAASGQPVQLGRNAKTP